MSKVFKLIETERLHIYPLVLDDTKSYYEAELRSYDFMVNTGVGSIKINL